MSIGLGGAVGGGAHVLVRACAHTYSPEHTLWMHSVKKATEFKSCEIVGSFSICSLFSKRKKGFPFYFVFCRLVFLLLPSSTSSSSSIHSFCDPNRNRRPRGVCSHVFSAIQLRQPSSVFLIIICQKCCDARQPKLKWMKATTREYVHEKKEADTFQVNIASVSSFFPFYFK